MKTTQRNYDYNYDRLLRQPRFNEVTPSRIYLHGCGDGASVTVHYKRYGKERRQGIIDALKRFPNSHFFVNEEYLPNLKYDIDLKYLLKKDILVRRRSISRGFFGWHNRTALCLKEQL